MGVTILVVCAFALLLFGLLGAVVPALPGPPLSYAGLLVLQWSGRGGFTFIFLCVWAAVVVAVVVADNFLPALMTKHFGGSRAVVIGSVVGLIAGIFFFPPVGIIAGPFLGAFVGELINNRADGAKALKVAFGAFLAFIVGTGAKLIASSMMIFYAVKAII
jgi:uncharacterized protein YqgC (DUF456 family)